MAKKRKKAVAPIEEKQPAFSEQEQFDQGMRRFLSVPKEELDEVVRREKEQRRSERATKRK